MGLFPVAGLGRFIILNVKAPNVVLGRVLSFAANPLWVDWGIAQTKLITVSSNSTKEATLEVKQILLARKSVTAVGRPYNVLYRSARGS